MKPQDILFFLVVLLLIFLKKRHYFLLAGISCLVLAMPMFTFWIFFTAERLTWYAGVFFLIFIFTSLRAPYKVQ